MRDAGLDRIAAGTAQAGQTRGGLAFAGPALRQRGPQLIALKPYEQIAGLDLCAFVDCDLQHTAGERAAHLDPRRRRHAGRELKRAHQGRHAGADDRHQGRAREPPGGQGGGKEGGEHRGCDG